MQFSKASTYGLIAVVHIARGKTNEPVQGRVIAESCRLPLEYLLKILQLLVRARVIQSERGRHGGFWLCKSPAETTVLEIVEAIDGTISEGFYVPGASATGNSTLEVLERLGERSSQFARSLLSAANIEQLIEAKPSPQQSTADMAT